jgi:hypothetical protein
MENAVRTLAALKTQDDDPAISRPSSSGGSGRIPPKREMESEITASVTIDRRQRRVYSAFQAASGLRRGSHRAIAAELKRRSFLNFHLQQRPRVLKPCGKKLRSSDLGSGECVTTRACGLECGFVFEVGLVIAFILQPITAWTVLRV